MTRRYARAPRGRRALGTAPCGRWRRLTVLGALGVEGMLAAMSVEAATSTAVFLAFLDRVLVPELVRTKPHAVVVMANLRPPRSGSGWSGPGCGCSTCRATRPSSPRSSRAGPRSRSGCAPRRHGPSRRWTTRSARRSTPSPPAMPGAGAAPAAMPSLQTDPKSALGGEAEDPMEEGPLGRQVVPGHGTPWPLASIAIASTPASVRRAVRKLSKPSLGRVRRLIRRWSCSTRLVQPAPTPVPGEAPQRALALQLAERTGVAREPVGHDLPRVAGVRPAERLAEEPTRRGVKMQ